LEVLSVNVGKPTLIKVDNKELHTGIVKSPVSSVLHLSSTQLEGDGQADLEFHGGADKALCVYCAEHYAYWEQNLGQPLPYGAFGENITVSGLLESEVCIGDIYSLGEAIVQVSGPRQPCFKLAKKHQAADLPIQFQDTGFTGYYFRVVQEGILPVRPQLLLKSKHPAGVTVKFVNRIKYQDKMNPEGIRRILAVPELMASWRGSFVKGLSEIEGSGR
jgi:MOSC domain-containing protein YiiM